MKPWFRNARHVALIAVTTSCASSAPTPAPAPPTSPPLAPVPAPVYDLSELPPPREILAAGRLPHPQTTLKGGVALFGKKVPVLGALTLERLASVVLGDGMADVLDWGKPLDVAVVDSGGANAEIVVSAAAEDLADAKKDLGSVFHLEEPDASGVIAIDVPPKNDARPLHVCALVPAFGPADHRLLCATSAHALAAAGPFLTRTVTRWTSTQDAHVEIYPVAYSKVPPPPPFAPDGLRSDADQIIRTMGQQAVADATRLDLDASLSATSVAASATVSLASVTSPIWRLGLAASRDARPAPDLFWQLPGDADAAFYWRGASPEEFGPLRASFLADIRAGLAQDGLSAAALDQAFAPFERLLFTGGPLLLAHGFDAEAAREAVDAAAPATAAQVTAEAEALARWSLLEVDEPFDRWSAGLRDVVTAFQHRPRGAARDDRSTLVLAPAAASLRLPAGAMQLIHTTPLDASKSRVDLPRSILVKTVHVLVVPQGEHTWLALGTSERKLVEKLHVVLDHAGPTLRDRPGLESLRDAPAGLAGFVTASLFGGWDVKTAPPWGGDRFSARQLLDRVHALDDHGRTPFAFIVDGHEEAGKSTLTLRVDASPAGILALLPAPR